jgi:hypothetical protein
MNIIMSLVINQIATKYIKLTTEFKGVGSGNSLNSHVLRVDA